MKVLLVAVNAKYIHSNLAVYCLKAYCKKYEIQVDIAEYTINQNLDEIIRDLYRKGPDIIAFSCYIWNIEVISKLGKSLKKILPDTKIWSGGPEVSYDAVQFLNNNSFAELVMQGEGEETFRDLLQQENGSEYETVRGITFRNAIGELVTTPSRGILDLSTVPFPYEDLKGFENRVVYYESSRGCPFSCSYCLSSIDKSVRFRNMELVKKELQFFLDRKVPQVKFVDRTFNCKHSHAYEIWKFIKDHDNGVTNFHFEISADLLKEEDFTLFHEFRHGLAQFEIGVQSTNEKTLEAIHRKTDLAGLKKRVDQLNEIGRIHQHLDLIAGLPYEDMESFRASFNDVYAMKPEQLQLGFLKVLKGSLMFENKSEFEIEYHSFAPYEVLKSKWVSYADIIRLKGIEEMVEVYYNSQQFRCSVSFLESFHETAFDLYDDLSDYYNTKGYFDCSHTRMRRYEILLTYVKDSLEFSEKQTELFKELLLYDLYVRENLKNRPEFAESVSVSKEEIRGIYENESFVDKYLSEYKSYPYKQMIRMTHIEKIHFDVETLLKDKKLEKKEQYVLFDYHVRNPLNYDARTIVLEDLELGKA